MQVLSLTESEGTLKIWPFKFRCEYEVVLSAVSLKMTLNIMNTGNTPFDFMALLHTYLKAQPIATACSCVVSDYSHHAQYLFRVT